VINLHDTSISVLLSSISVPLFFFPIFLSEAFFLAEVVFGVWLICRHDTVEMKNRGHYFLWSWCLRLILISKKLTSTIPECDSLEKVSFTQSNLKALTSTIPKCWVTFSHSKLKPFCLQKIITP
jgi:hypothetical protein